jgi:hypothetical protein
MREDETERGKGIVEGIGIERRDCGVKRKVTEELRCETEWDGVTVV